MQLRFFIIQNTIGFNILLWWKMALWMNFLGEKTPLPSSTFIKWIGWILWAHWTCLIWLILTQVRLAKSPVGGQITGTGLPDPDREKCRIIPVTGTASGIPVEHWFTQSVIMHNLFIYEATFTQQSRFILVQPLHQIRGLTVIENGNINSSIKVACTN